MRLLVSFAYIEQRSDAVENLEFFLTAGMPSTPRDDVTHGIIVNDYNCSVKLPERSDLFVLRRPNVGFDYGSHHALLEFMTEQPAMQSLTQQLVKNGHGHGPHSKSSNITHPLLTQLPFTHFFFFNCGVRGPFLPSYWPARIHWSHAYTSRLTSKVKLVGSSIVCLSAADRCVRQDPQCYGPKVEGFLWSADVTGMQVLLNKGTVFRQHRTKAHAVLDGEYGATRAIFEAGYSIDCPLLAYQGVDWRNKSNWQCNKHLHPSRPGTYFGMSMHPLETVFHKTSWGDPPWRVAPQEVAAYTKWRLKETHRRGKRPAYDHWAPADGAGAAAESSSPFHAAMRWLG